MSSPRPEIMRDRRLEEEFFSDVVLPNNQTVREYLYPAIEEAYKDGEIPTTLPMLGQRN